MSSCMCVLVTVVSHDVNRSNKWLIMKGCISAISIVVAHLSRASEVLSGQADIHFWYLFIVCTGCLEST